jgi:energy-coupling factor transporter ATP-binding protein EcfA2
VNAPGSTWHCWDPHVHAPGTLLNDQFGGDWETFLHRLETANPTIRAIGVTDYFCIQGYEWVLERKNAGRLQNIDFIFPNVEMRLDVKTEKSKGINLHLLFSPEDPDHRNHIHRVLGSLEFEFQETRYTCTPTSLAQLGRAFHAKPLDDAAAMRIGANQFKTRLPDLKKLYADPWANRNCLIAVSGSGVDGTPGLQGDDSFAATRQEIERFSHIIFTRTPSQRQFWLGQGVLGVKDIEEKFLFLKACLNGSDAHEGDTVGSAPAGRYCWLKGSVQFETLRQAVIEPEHRVWLGLEAPKAALPSLAIQAVHPSGTPWIANSQIELNPGLVAVIGARGSGKTALVEIIAASTRSMDAEPSSSSFIRRASRPKNLLFGATVAIQWGNGDASMPVDLDQWAGEYVADSDALSEARYLSQQFVDRLCSSSGLAVELRREIERVVFEAIPNVDRLEADTFATLATRRLGPITSQQQQLREFIHSLSEQIASEDINHRSLPDAEKRQKAAIVQLERLGKDLAALLPKDKGVHVKALQHIEGLYRAAEQKLEALNLEQQNLIELAQRVATIRKYSEPEQWNGLKTEFSAIRLSDQQWSAFRMVFAGDVDAEIKAVGKLITNDIAIAKEGDPEHPIDFKLEPTPDWPLIALGARLEVARKDVGIDQESQRKYDDLLKRIRADEAALRNLEKDIAVYNGADGRKQALIEKRREAYVDVFKSIVEEETTLRQLYAPLADELKGATGALAKLAVSVHRRVDVESWSKRGEDFIDLRVAEKLRGKGTLRKAADQYLLAAWTSGTPEDVAAAMEAFRAEYHKDLISAVPPGVPARERSTRIQQVAAWLYDTRHVKVEYGIQFDGVDIEHLSPGTRGIVLLLLYLAIDKRDQRPLIVDQPEENLDPRSVYEELVPHFRNACRRRQVILVTHNANLVVNTDADQVIVARSIPSKDGGLPQISYSSGGIEESGTRRAVCEILEGGERALAERARRYRFRWR